MTEPLSIGNEIKDSYTETYKWVNSNLRWLNDISGFYKERARLEQEYSGKLSRLVGDFLIKKADASVLLGVGESPTATPGSIEAANVIAWNEMLLQTEQISRDHSQLASDFQQQVAKQLTNLYSRLDSVLININGYYQEMTNTRDMTYKDLDKAKRRYDDACVTMEQYRGRYTKASTEKNQKKLQEKKTLMQLCKNDYIVKISQANRVKDKYYFQDIPESVDLLQDLNEIRVVFLNEIWKQANSLEVTFSEKIKTRTDISDSVVTKNKPSLATAMFIDHNKKSWQEPSDFLFQASPVWHDDDHLVFKSSTVVDDLKLKLAEAEQELSKMTEVTDPERQTLSTLSKEKYEFKSNEENLENGEEYFNILREYLSTVSSFTNHETMKLLAEVQIESIENNVPDDIDLSHAGVDLSNVKKKNRNTKTFSKIRTGFSLNNIVNSNIIPHSNLSTSHSKGLGGSKGFSGSKTFGNIGSISAPRGMGRISTSNGFGGITAPKLNLFGGSKKHHVPIPSSNNNSHHNNLTSSVSSPRTPQKPTRASSTKTFSPASNQKSPNTFSEDSEDSGAWDDSDDNDDDHSFQASSINTNPQNNNSSNSTCKVLYPYNKEDDDEVTVNPQDSISLLEKDTGSGWTKIQNNSTGQVGLVPTSYVEIKETEPSQKKNPVLALPPARKVASDKTMSVLYPYEAQGDDEMSLKVGDVIKVLKPDDGSGWTLGELDGVQALFPTSYCK